MPALALPKGGGAIRGIGEKFGVDAATGTASFSVPLPVSPGRGGVAPDLSLTYDSGAGAGMFGWGWRLGLPVISRRTDRGLPRYLDRDRDRADTFVLAGQEDLVPLLKENGTPVIIPDPTFAVHCYAPRREGSFSRIERWAHKTNDETHWRVISGANVTTIFGPTAATRIADPENASRVFTWLAAETFDDKGNRTVFEYKQEDSEGVLKDNETHEASRRGWTNPQRHLKRIRYGNFAPKGRDGDDRFLFELVLDFGDHPGERPTRFATAGWPARPDPISVRRAGFETRTYRLCERALMFHRFPNGHDEEATLVRALAFDYRRSPVASLMTGARAFGYAATSDDRMVAEEAPALTFEYQLAPEDLEPVARTLDPRDLDELPAGFADASVQWIDIDGDGVAGALIEREDRWVFKPNLSPLGMRPDGVPAAKLGAMRTLEAMPSGGLAAGGRFVDIEGDGLPELVHFEGAVPGFAGRDEDGAWLPRRPFQTLPNVEWSSPELRFLDLTGDGLPDVVIDDTDQLLWFPALGREGYGEPRSSRLATDEEKGPVLVFRQKEEALFLADMSGDGLTDLVRIRSREVAYWPNLGYGRFGPKVTMSAAPDLGDAAAFDSERVRLADTDGSGTTDLIYLGADGWSVHVNCAGNRFAPARLWEAAPPLDSLSQVDAFDLLGNGTACLVWSTRLPASPGRQVLYLPLAGGRKPYLMTAIHNGLGLETRVHYAPSTVYQLRDRIAGTPWVTRLPFPVQVVERVETLDRVSGHRFTSSYAYHHGAYDGREREFRGFGFVEQWDAERWSDAPAGAPSEGIASQVPPVRTRRWFHTGMPSPAADMSLRYERDFFGGLGDPAADTAERDLFRRTRIADAAIPAGLPARDHRDVCRALKGALLREEVYADDGTARARVPYKISVAGYAAQVRQPAGAHHPAIVFVHDRALLDVHLERDLETPRVTQSFVLKVGRFGDVLERVEVSLGGPAPPFAGPGADAITLPRAFVDEADVTIHIDEPDVWRTPLPAEARRFALAGAGLESAWPLAESKIRELVRDATPLAPTDATNPRATPCGKRLLARSRILHRRDDLSGPLPFMELHPKALPYETYTLAFTPPLLARTFGELIPAGVPLGEAGYVDLEGDGNHWVPSGRAYFQRTKNHPEEAASAGDRAVRAEAERNEAEAHFHLARAFRDPFGGHVFVDYDRGDLFPIAVEDRVGNVVTAEYDTRALQPRLIVDANGNRAFAAYDTLGRLASTAVAGRVGRVDGDTLPLPDTFLEIPDLEALLTALADPALQQSRAAALLGTATARTLTDSRRFLRNGKPAFSVALSRETHVSDLARGTVSRIAIAVAYVDGTGRIVQTKLLTEPGPLVDGGPPVPVRWITTGWTIYDNKGNPVRTYEPFHSAGPGYEPDRLAGVSRIVFRDPLSRVIGALNPDGSIEKTRFTAWSQKVWDTNDTVLVVDHVGDRDIGAHLARLDAADRRIPWHTQRFNGSKGEEARKAAVATEGHAETPAEIYLDALGRTVLTVEDGGPIGKLVTSIVLDDDGSEREIIDTRKRVIVRYQHDLFGRRTLQASMEAGSRRVFPAADGSPLYRWDDRGHVGRHRYDQARRPTDTEIANATGFHLRDRVVYGEALGDALNHRGRIHQVFDGAGLVTTAAYDFKGAPVVVQRRFARNPRGRPDWSSDPEVTLESETFTARTRNDAVGRPVQSVLPVSNRPGAPVSVVQPIYDESGKLDAVDLWLDLVAPPAGLLDPATATKRVVRGIDHDAQGRRTAIRYGNGTETTFAFDPETFCLAGVRTTRGALGDGPGGAQNLSYTYDAVGNITHVADAAQQTIYFNGAVVTPSSRFGYDALYRLVTAEGREHRGLGARPWPSWNDAERRGDHPEDGAAMRNYTQRFVYDAVGNIDEVRHTADEGSWTRTYRYLEPSLLPGGDFSNRLTRTKMGEDEEIFSYDAHGNVTRTSHLASMSYDDADRFAGADLGGGGRVDYQYGATGDRARKVVERHGEGGVVTGFEERLYLGVVEIFRLKDRDGTVVRERETLYVADDTKAILHVESRTRGSAASDPAPPRLFRYQFDNHLGSASLELDDTGAVISYEEYHPYGSTSLQTVRSRTETPKRYRYTGKERDEETGFTYHGARYYALWVGRWMSCDPVGVGDGMNLYLYARNNPIVLSDTDGQMSRAAQAQYDKDRHPSSRTTGDQLGDVYKKSEDVPKNLKAVKHTGSSAMEQQRRFKQGGAKRAQDKAEAAKTAIVTKEEKFAAAKAGARNWLLDKAASAGGYVLGGPILQPLGKLAVEGALKPLRAPEPPGLPVGLRQVETKENYEAAQTTLTATEVGVSIAAPLIAESAFASKAATTSGMSNPFEFMGKLNSIGQRLQAQVAEAKALVKPFQHWPVNAGGVPHQLQVGGATSFIEGQQVTSITFSHPNAHALFSSGGMLKLPQGTILGPAPVLQSGRLPIGIHVERSAVVDLEKRGAGGGLATSSGDACIRCAEAWYNGEFPTWLHQKWADYGF